MQSGKNIINSFFSWLTITGNIKIASCKCEFCWAWDKRRTCICNGSMLCESSSRASAYTKCSPIGNISLMSTRSRNSFVFAIARRYFKSGSSSHVVRPSLTNSNALICFITAEHSMFFIYGCKRHKDLKKYGKGSYKFTIRRNTMFSFHVLDALNILNNLPCKN